MSRRVFNRQEKLKPLIKAIEKIYPPALAEKEWDNTGLLIDCSNDELTKSQELRIVLTIDLTEAVCDEAITNRADCIIAYHPFIFNGIKTLNKDSPTTRTIFRLIREKISVYSPHTAADAALGGVNDWLARAVALGSDNILQSSILKAAPVVPGFEGAGYGRVITLREPQTLPAIIEHVRRRLRMQRVPVVRATRHGSELISTIALCPGSGKELLQGVKADLIVTGELGHHDQLRLRESGTSAIITGHWNSEAGFLGIFAEHLAQQLSALGAHAPNAKIMVATSDRSPMEYL